MQPEVRPTKPSVSRRSNELVRDRQINAIFIAPQEEGVEGDMAKSLEHLIDEVIGQLMISEGESSSHSVTNNLEFLKFTHK